MRKLYCFSFENFHKQVSFMGVPEDISIISIVGSEGTRGQERHMFEGPDVLNLEFDDILEDKKDLVCFTQEMASKSYAFIKDAIERGDGFYIHCAAGLSRSQAFIRFIEFNWPDIEWEKSFDNRCIYYNVDVFNKLCREARKDW